MCEVTQKTCSRCKEKKDFSLFHKNKSQKDGFSHYCKLCRKTHRGENYSDKNRERVKKWYKKNRQTCIERHKIWRINNPEKARKNKRNDRKKSILELKNAYIKKLLCHNNSLKYGYIPQSLIECKRIEIQIKRQIKEMTK